MTTDLSPTITDDEVAALPLSEARADLLRELLATTSAAAGPVRRSRRWLGALAAAAAVAAIAVPVGLTQLGGDDGQVATDRGATSPPASAGPAAGPPALQLRVVTLTSDLPQEDHPDWQQLVSFTCPDRAVAAPAEEAELACDSRGAKYLLEPAAVAGGVVSAEAALLQGQINWVVEVHLDDDAATDLGDLSEELVGSATQFAFVVDGEVLSAPTMDGVIDGGVLQLSGDFTEATATELAAHLSE